MQNPLRILAVVNLPWDPRLGAARVWIELAEEWTKAGHVVERFCLTDAFATPTSSRPWSAFRQLWFTVLAARFVKRHGDRFDVIDALIGTLPFSKKALRFRGLLVARSVGLPKLYEHFSKRAQKRWLDQPRGRWAGSVLYGWLSRRMRKNAERSLRGCDLINVLNEDEKEELAHDLRACRNVIIQPYGLNDQHRNALEEAKGPAQMRLARKKISFVGMWSLRKGSRDWPLLIRKIWERHPDAHFEFLGTMCPEEEVFAQLKIELRDKLHCVPTYDPSDLPRLLTDCAVGLFPSYIEGFGLAVIEQLACGIPVVAYDVPGPRQILTSERATLLVPAGDVDEMAASASAILSMNTIDYSALSGRSQALARGYRWSRIAAETASEYRNVLNSSVPMIASPLSFPNQPTGG